MRRLLATAALVGVALFATAACADVPQPPVGSPTGTPTVATQAQTSLADKATTCAAWKTLSKEIEDKSAPHLTALESAQADPLKAVAAYSELTKLLNDYRTGTAELEAKAGDAEVKSALKDEVAAVTKLQSDLNAAGSDPTKVQAALNAADDKPRTKLETLCK